jgi:hypothetical protein
MAILNTLARKFFYFGAQLKVLLKSHLERSVTVYKSTFGPFSLLYDALRWKIEEKAYRYLRPL